MVCYLNTILIRVNLVRYSDHHLITVPVLKYSGGSKTERVWYSDGRMCLVFEWCSVFEWSKKVKKIVISLGRFVTTKKYSFV